MTTSMAKYTYEITARPVDLGGGWRLRVHDEHGEEIAGGVFPAPAADAAEVAAWWDGLDDGEPVEWVERSGAASPAGAHHAFRLAEEYAAAEAEGQGWVDGHPGQAG